jgi:hypothetical protein
MTLATGADLVCHGGVSARLLVGFIIGASALAVGKAATSKRAAAPPPVVQRPAPEKPWLAKEAAAQIVAEGGALGPLFDGVDVGGPAPTPKQRALIAEFARKHDVLIDFDVRGGVLETITFEVTYGGCCGYEAVDLLARRIGRPYNGGGCFGEKEWLNDWAASPGDGTRLRAKVDVNTITLRWDAELSVPELLARADGVIGRPADAVSRHAGERWISLERGKFLLEEPYPFEGLDNWARATRSFDLGFHLGVEGNRVTSVTFAVRDNDIPKSVVIPQLVAHWGKPERTGDTYAWTKVDRTITAEVTGEGSGMIEIALRDR